MCHLLLAPDCSKLIELAPLITHNYWRLNLTNAEDGVPSDVDPDNGACVAYLDLDRRRSGNIEIAIFRSDV